MDDCSCRHQDVCEPGLSRRLFLKSTGAGVVALGALSELSPVMAGPFSAGDFEKLVPSDKKLSPDWLRMLTARGEPAWFSGEDLKHIGMPVGGVCCGQVYLSGDGRLWHWDIFNQGIRTNPGGPHYAKPMSTDSGIGLGFTLRAQFAGKETVRPLDRTGFSNLRFRGAYPMGFVNYADDGCPVTVSLEAFSPFCPLEVDDSSLPLTVMRYTVRNTSKQTVEVALAGQLANPVLQHSENDGAAEFVNTIRRRKGATGVHYTVEDRSNPLKPGDVVFEDFESNTYENWTVEGTAFGEGPVVAAGMPAYQRDVGARGRRLVNSHNTRQGESLAEGDAHVGRMTSKAFTIKHRYIHALIGGGADAGKTSLQLLIGGEAVMKVSGKNDNRLQRESFDAGQYSGQEARLRIVDEGTGSWGNIGVDHIVFSDHPTEQADRPDVVFEDFESDTYENWTVKGTAFGKGPVVAAELPDYQGDVHAHGKQLVNSHNTRQGEDPAAGDAHAGTMTSKPFTVERRYIHALVGGGADAGTTSLQLLIDDKVVAKLAGKNSNAMRRVSFRVAEHEGQTARLRIVDENSGGWGNIGVDHIVFSDRPAKPPVPVDQRRDMGDMTLAILDDGEGVFSEAEMADGDTDPLFKPGEETARSSGFARPVGAVGKTISLQPGEEATVSFAVAWRFPNHPAPVGTGHYYAERFASSLSAVEHLADRYGELYARTRRWHETWYDSTLPYWLLDRTFTNTSTLATSTCMRLEGGRFYGWEGVGCCGGTCIHVWHYAQSVGRVFPELARITREGVDYGLAYQAGGIVGYRGEQITHEAIDGQCGTILRVYREHTMSPTDAFLGRIWPRVKESIQYLMAQDGDSNGVLEGKQYNTLDAAWYGPCSWISSLYVGALRAGAAMAREMGDGAFAGECDTLADRGGKWLTENLFDGEFYYQRRDPKHPDAFGSGIGCHIDQVLGQGWAHQLGLSRVLPKKQTESALKSLWRYNFTPDVAAYRKRFTAGRWYAMPGEAGLIMCTFPKGGEAEARGGKPGHGFAGYFNECMNGFEYQAAGHMIAEGLVREGLAVTRAIHERYSPSRRNPYNEIECGDHYARSMASHGVFVSVCGFEHHGPEGYIGFAPRLTPENFRAPFIAAEGWGTFAQQREGRAQVETLRLNYGQLKLKRMAFGLAGGKRAASARVTLDGAELEAVHRMAEDRVEIRLADAATVRAGQTLEIEIRV